MFSFMITSCEESEKSKKDKTKLYLPAYKIYDDKDSTFSGIKVYIANIDGHKIIYHLYSGKNKSQMIIEHMEKECKKCIQLNKKQNK